MISVKPKERKIARGDVVRYQQKSSGFQRGSHSTFHLRRTNPSSFAKQNSLAIQTKDFVELSCETPSFSGKRIDKYPPEAPIETFKLQSFSEAQTVHPKLQTVPAGSQTVIAEAQTEEWFSGACSEDEYLSAEEYLSETQTEECLSETRSEECPSEVQCEECLSVVQCEQCLAEARAKICLSDTEAKVSSETRSEGCCFSDQCEGCLSEARNDEFFSEIQTDCFFPEIRSECFSSGLSEESFSKTRSEESLSEADSDECRCVIHCEQCLSEAQAEGRLSEALSEAQSEWFLSEAESEKSLSSVYCAECLSVIHCEQCLSEARAEWSLSVAQIVQTLSGSQTEVSVAESRTGGSLLGTRSEGSLSEIQSEEVLLVQSEECLSEAQSEECLAEAQSEECLAEAQSEECLPEAQSEECLAESQSEEYLAESQSEECLAESQSEECITESRSEACLAVGQAEVCISNAEEQVSFSEAQAGVPILEVQAEAYALKAQVEVCVSEAQAKMCVSETQADVCVSDAQARQSFSEVRTEKNFAEAQAEECFSVSQTEDNFSAEKTELCVVIADIEEYLTDAQINEFFSVIKTQGSLSVTQIKEFLLAAKTAGCLPVAQTKECQSAAHDEKGPSYTEADKHTKQTQIVECFTQAFIEEVPTKKKCSRSLRQFSSRLNLTKGSVWGELATGSSKKQHGKTGSDLNETSPFNASRNNAPDLTSEEAGRNILFKSPLKDIIGLAEFEAASSVAEPLRLVNSESEFTNVCHSNGISPENRAYYGGDKICEFLPFVYALCPSKFKTHCSFCFKSLNQDTKKACQSCSSVYYCDSRCQDQHRIHRRECQYLKYEIPHVEVHLVAHLKWKLEDPKSQEIYDTVGEKSYFYKDLISYENSMKDVPEYWERATMGYQTFRNVFYDCQISFEEYFVLLAKCLKHSLAIMDHVGPIHLGAGVYLGLAAFEHSCRPTANPVYMGTLAQIICCSDSGITDPQKATLRFVNCMLPRKKRRELLVLFNGGKCNCVLCQDEEFEARLTDCSNSDDYFTSAITAAISLKNAADSNPSDERLAKEMILRSVEEVEAREGEMSYIRGRSLEFATRYFKEPEDYEQVTYYYEKLLPIHKFVYGLYNAKTMYTLLHLGALHSRAGHRRESKEYFSDALQVAYYIFGHEHPYFRNLRCRFIENDNCDWKDFFTIMRTKLACQQDNSELDEASVT